MVVSVSVSIPAAARSSGEKDRREVAQERVGASRSGKDPIRSELLSDPASSSRIGRNQDQGERNGTGRIVAPARMVRAFACAAKPEDVAVCDHGEQSTEAVDRRQFDKEIYKKGRWGSHGT